MPLIGKIITRNQFIDTLIGEAATCFYDHGWLKRSTTANDDDGDGGGGGGGGGGDVPNCLRTDSYLNEQDLSIVRFTLSNG